MIKKIYVSLILVLGLTSVPSIVAKAYIPCDFTALHYREQIWNEPSGTVNTDYKVYQHYIFNAAHGVGDTLHFYWSNGSGWKALQQQWDYYPY